MALFMFHVLRSSTVSGDIAIPGNTIRFSPSEGNIVNVESIAPFMVQFLSSLCNITLYYCVGIHKVQVGALLCCTVNSIYELCADFPQYITLVFLHLLANIRLIKDDISHTPKMFREDLGRSGH